MADTLSQFAELVNEKAKKYLSETGKELETFPTSIVDFVIEYVKQYCRIPYSYSEEQVNKILDAHIATIAMACVEVYERACTEGNTSYSENGISRAYDSAWISNAVMFTLPRFAKIF